MKKIFLVLILMIAFTGLIFSDDMISLDKAELSWTVDQDQLTITMEAETKGWIAVGLGSRRMDGSVMFIGYNKNGEAFFEEHLGKGHGHKKTVVQRPVDYKVTENNGVTILEFTVKKSDFIKSDETELPVIVAYGARDNFRSIHRYRDSTVLEFNRKQAD